MGNYRSFGRRARPSARLFLFTLLVGCQANPAEVDLAEGVRPIQIPRISKPEYAAQLLRQMLSGPSGSEPVKLNRTLRDALSQVHTDPGELPRLKVKVDGERLDLPLRKTQVKATIVGYVAEVEVTQSYANPFRYPIEAVYVFPLPENSAVNDMKMVIGKRVIEAQIRKRAEARNIYREAASKGHTAALLEQERPNIFTQSVANIAPETDVDVTIRYVQNLTYDAGEYEFVFPMVVGPRFTGTSQPAGEVPDASRITPALVGGGFRTGHDITLELTVDAGFPITRFAVPTHDVHLTPTRDGTLDLCLSPADHIPNRDFVLTFGVSGAEPQATLLTHRSSRHGYFSLLIQPPELDIDEAVGRREVIFVVDVSGSMSGVPLALCKEAMKEALNGLRPVDTFNVITFESRTGRAFRHPRPANDANTEAALDFVAGLRAGGGTMMELGVQAAFATAVEEGRHRYVFFMTDGYIGNESKIMSLTRTFVTRPDAAGHRARVFALGVGSSINRHLLAGIANAGKGLAVYATNREHPALAVDKIFHTIDHPVLENVQIDWGTLKPTELYPAVPGDLFASRPIVIHGKFDDRAIAGQRGMPAISIRGRIGGREIHLPLEVDLQRGERRDVLSSLWARAKVDWLEQSLIYEGHQPTIVDRITELGLAHRLVTAYTSLVAVDRSKTVAGKSLTIAQPVDSPEGVDPEMAGAEQLTTIVAAQGNRAAKSRLDGPSGSMRYGIRGTGRGGGGTGEGTIGLGNLTTIGHGGGGGTGTGYGRGSGGLGSRGRGARIRSGAAEVKGALDREVVQQVLKRHRREIEVLYHRALAGDPQLSGRVVIKLTIAPSGRVRVATVAQSTIADKRFEACLLKAVRKWQFPKPAGGGVVVVTVPFDFGPQSA